MNEEDRLLNLKAKAKVAFVQVVLFERKAKPEYTALQVVMAVDHFWKTMNDQALVDLAAYIDWAKANGDEDFRIAGTVGHDLGGAGSLCFLPRSDGYSKRLEG
jgi:dienelactone hydrolase